MKTVAVGFSRPKKSNLLSFLIMKVQGTDYSHVYHKFYSEKYDRNIIYQASGLQVNFIGEELFRDHCIVIEEFEFQVSDEVYKKMMIKAIDRAGYPYSIKQLFNIAIYILTGISSMFMDGRSAYVCSELVAEMLQELNMTINVDLDIITPRDIYQLLKRAKKWPDLIEKKIK